MADRQIKSILRFITDKASIDRSERDLDRIQKALDDQRTAAEKAQQAWTSLEDVSVRVSAAGASVLAPLTIAANKYVESLGDATETSRRWLAATEKAQNANLELGRKATEALLPYKELLADILTQVSQVDPRLLEAGVAVGSGLALVGAAGLIAAQVGRFAAMVQILGTHIKALAASQRGQRAGVGIAALGVGTAIGFGLVRAAGSATGNQRLANFGLDDAAQHLKQAIGLFGALFIKAAQQFAKLFEEFRHQWLVGKIKVSDGIQQIADAIKGAILGFLKTLGELELDLGSVKGIDLGSIDIGGKLGIDVAKIDQELEELGNRASDTANKLDAENMRHEEANSLIDENTQKLTDFMLVMLGFKETAEEISAAEEKRRAEEAARLLDHTRNQLDLWEQYFSDLTDAEDAYQESVASSLKAYEDSRANIIENYQRQQARQLEDHERSLMEAREGFNKQQERDTSDHNKRLKALQDNFVKDQQAAQKAFTKDRAEFIEQQQKDDLQRLQDFNLKRQREQEDHQQRLLEAVGRRDGIAILNEIRNFNKQQKRGQQDFDKESTQREQQTKDRLKQEQDQFEALQAERANQLKAQIQSEKDAFAERQREAENAFREREQQQIENFNRQQQRQEADHQRSLAELESQFNEQQAQQQRAFERMQNERQQDYNRQLRNLNAHFNNTEKATNDHYRRLQTQQNLYNAVIQQSSQGLVNALRNSSAVSKLFGSGSGRSRSSGATVSANDLNQNPANRSRYSSSLLSNRASGGYFNHGAGNEYALSRDTTRMLERSMGSLTQSKIQNMTTNSRSIGDININIGDTGSMSPQQVGRIVREKLIETLEELG